MESLTHKDRESIRNSLHQMQQKTDCDDDSLIKDVSTFLLNVKPASGKERYLHQNILDLLNFLRLNPHAPGTPVARGALCSIRSAQNANSGLHSGPTIQTLAFLSGFALHEISDAPATKTADEVHALDPDERQAAEEMLLEFTESPPVDDKTLIEFADRFVDAVWSYTSTGLISRFRRNILQIRAVLSQDNWSREQKNWARGALSYIRFTDDAVPDDLGIVGLLDDMYIANTAVYLINPDSPPWTELISELHDAWPFLRDLVFVRRGEEYSYSEFALVSTALACPALRTLQEDSRTALLLPFSGLIPFMIAFGAAFGLVFEADRNSGDTPNFRVGQKVKVDNAAVAIYDGVVEREGQSYIRLKQYHAHRGQQLESAFLIPLFQCGRLCPAPEAAIPRGNIPTLLNYTETPLTALERILHLPFPFQFQNAEARVWLVTGVSTTRKVASEIFVEGQRLQDILPMGHVTQDGTVKTWSTRFGETGNILTVVSDPDLAVEILEDENLTNKDIIVVDLSGSNRSRISALECLRDLEARILCVVEERDGPVISTLETNDFDFWEWTQEEAVTLLPYNAGDGNAQTHPFSTYETRARKSFSVQQETTLIASREADLSREAVYALAAHIRRSDDIPEVLDRIMDRLMEVLFLLVRLPVRLENNSGPAEKASRLLADASRLTETSFFLSADDQGLASNVIQALHALKERLQSRNPKSDAIRKILEQENCPAVLLPAGTQPDTVSAPGDWPPDVPFLSWADLRHAPLQTLVVPFWPGRERIWKLISNPPAERLHFILFGFEEEWRRSFEQARTSDRIHRASRNRRANVFSGVSGWPRPATTDPQPGNRNTEEENRDLAQLRFSRQRQRLVSNAKSENEAADVEAGLIIFSGGTHAFFTRNHEAHTVTSLLNGQAAEPEEDATVTTLEAGRLAVGDVVLFLRGTDRDAIREVADNGLPPGCRGKAGLWQKALRAYVQRTGASVTRLQRELRGKGTRRHSATIKNWLESGTIIAPRNAHKGDLDAIAAVTGDPELTAGLKECEDAITRVWGEHLKAAGTLAKRILEQVGDRIMDDIDLDTPLDVGDGMVLARIEYIDRDPVAVPRSRVNCLLEDD